jgi:hypothetical protein
MLLPIIGVALGALVMGSTKPKTSYEKLRALGARSGFTYEVEDFTSAGFIVVRAPDGTEGVLSRRLLGDPRGPGFEWSRGRGNPATLKLLRADFGVTNRTPAQVKAPTGASTKEGQP